MNLAGKSLGKYQILAEIGRGGMGAVYRGYDPALNRPVAIKVMAPHLTWDERFVERFLREARTVARLNHPHIVSIHDVGQQDGIYYLVMAFIEGESLGTLIAREGRLAPDLAAGLLEQVAGALDYAHSRGVVHRDVKPANILLADGSGAILTDFGIAHAADLASLTATGATLGTPEYMSPEQARGNPPDARSDVYSLAVVLYEMLTGHVPFRAETPLAVLRMQAEDAPPPPRRLVPSLSPALEAVVLRALSKDPDYRPARAGELARATTGALAGRMPAPVPGSDAPAAAGKPPAPPARAAPPSRRRRRAWPLALLGLVSVALIVAGVWAAFGDNTVSKPPTMAPSLQPPPATDPQPQPTRPSAEPVSSNVHIEYVLGASNTMMQPLEAGQTKLDAARAALAQHWKELPSSLHVGLRAYGHRISAADEASCLDTELMAPIAPGNPDRMTEQVKQISARGMAPLDQALIEASGDFDFAPARSNALILIADGGDSCGERPCQSVKAHHEVGLDYSVYVVGLAVDGPARQELACLARSSQGQYRDASNRAEILQALNSFVRDIEAGAP